MKFTDLPKEKQEALETTGIHLVRYGSLVGHGNEVDDAIRLPKDTKADLNKFKGYRASTAWVWFEFVTRSVSDEVALKLVEEALTPPTE